VLKLIINADDLGLSKACNQGILDGLNNGIVTDTTILINANYAGDAIKSVSENDIRRIGLHLNLTCGSPVLPVNEVPSLINSNGRFYNRIKNLLPVINFKEAERELRAQVEKFYETGMELNHIDCHHHLHMYDGFDEIVNELAKDIKAPLRHTDPVKREKMLGKGINTTDYFTMEFYGERATIKGLKDILNRYDNGTLEIMTHPGIVDDELYGLSSYNLFRQVELDVLKSDEIKSFIRERGIQLINYDELGCSNE
jgi:predicted glycoside hydrolase/deacetylase ChbG (UPF0249 family)